jgi:hypothetical protein
LVYFGLAVLAAQLGASGRFVLLVVAVVYYLKLLDGPG